MQVLTSFLIILSSAKITIHGQLESFDLEDKIVFSLLTRSVRIVLNINFIIVKSRLLFFHWISSWLSGHKTWKSWQSHGEKWFRLHLFNWLCHEWCGHESLCVKLKCCWWLEWGLELQSWVEWRALSCLGKWCSILSLVLRLISISWVVIALISFVVVSLFLTLFALLINLSQHFF